MKTRGKVKKKKKMKSDNTTEILEWKKNKFN